MNLPEIPESATLSEWQAYTRDLVKARGWDKAEDLETFLLFTEEVGELAKAFRRHRQLFMESPTSNNSKEELAGELADVLSYLLDLSERVGIDIEQALIAKERFNRGRKWE